MDEISDDEKRERYKKISTDTYFSQLHITTVLDYDSMTRSVLVSGFGLPDYAVMTFDPDGEGLLFQNHSGRQLREGDKVVVAEHSCPETGDVLFMVIGKIGVRQVKND